MGVSKLQCKALHRSREEWCIKVYGGTTVVLLNALPVRLLAWCDRSHRRSFVAILYTVYCILYTVCCILYTVYCTWYAPIRPVIWYYCNIAPVWALMSLLCQSHVTQGLFPGRAVYVMVQPWKAGNYLRNRCRRVLSITCWPTYLWLINHCINHCTNHCIDHWKYTANIIGVPLIIVFSCLWYTYDGVWEYYVIIPFAICQCAALIPIIPPTYICIKRVTRIQWLFVGLRFPFGLLYT